MSSIPAHILKENTLLFYFALFYFLDSANLSEKLASYFSGKNRIKDRLSDDFLVHCQSMTRFSDVVEGVFRSCEIKYSRLTESDLHKLLYKLLNPKRVASLPMPLFREDESLMDQLLYNCPKASGEGFEFEDSSLRWLP